MTINRDDQAQQTKTRIYDAAVLLMQKNGVKKTTIEEICKKAQVSVGSFYNYYQSKEDILFASFEAIDRYFADVAAPELYKLSGKNQLARYFQHYGHYVSCRGLDIIRHLFFYSENKSFIDPERYMHKLLRVIVQQQIDDGLIVSRMKAEALEAYLFIVARGIVYNWCLHEGQYDLSVQMQQFMDITLDALYPRTSPQD